MATIKLERILQEELVSIRFKMPESKYAELGDYLAFFNEIHRSDVDLPTLLPHLISAFIAEDRAFIRRRAEHRPKPKRIRTPEALPPKPDANS